MGKRYSNLTGIASDHSATHIRLAFSILLSHTEYILSMTPEAIQQALADISGEQDLTIKHLKLASLCSTVFREHHVELVVVGGSAIEFYTEGSYTSGDIDLCLLTPATLPVRQRQEIMGKLGAAGGPRSWQVAGVFVDILGELENLAHTQLRRIAGPYGEVCMNPVEELLVERVLVSVYPGEHPPARECAKKLATAALLRDIELDWQEVKRLANLKEYLVWAQAKELIHEQSKALNVGFPYHPDE
jgi:hypothetical protein